MTTDPAVGGSMECWRAGTWMVLLPRCRLEKLLDFFFHRSHRLRLFLFPGKMVSGVEKLLPDQVTVERLIKCCLWIVWWARDMKKDHK